MSNMRDLDLLEVMVVHTASAAPQPMAITNMT